MVGSPQFVGKVFCLDFGHRRPRSCMDIQVNKLHILDTVFNVCSAWNDVGLPDVGLYSHFFSSVAHVWVSGAKTTGPIVKKKIT
jgi:hypothetical protein